MNDDSHADLEVKITRLLDGELPADERSELEREVLRAPEAHALLRDTRAVDELCRAALDEALAPRRAAAPSRWRWAWPAAVAAAAAVAIVAVVLSSAFQDRPDTPPREIAKTPPTPPSSAPATVELVADEFDPAPPPETFVRPVRRVDRIPVGLFDAESGQFRVIQVDREQTQMQPVWLDL